MASFVATEKPFPILRSMNSASTTFLAENHGPAEVQFVGEGGGGGGTNYTLAAGQCLIITSTEPTVSAVARETKGAPRVAAVSISV